MSADNAQRRAVIVTGASGLVGGSVARTVAEAGYEVVPVDVRAGTVGGLDVTACDITDTQQVVQLMESIQTGGAQLYGLVNAAAVIPTAGLWDVQVDGSMTVLKINTWGSLNIAREASKLMAAGGAGRIINIASVAAYTGGLVGGPHYAASKAGVIVLTKVLAKELAAQGITANAIAPGALDSPATQALPDEARTALVDRIPAGRFGTRDEITGAVTYLLTPAAGYMTGATLDINGGVHLR